MKLFCPDAKASDPKYDNVCTPWDRFNPPTLLRDRAEALYTMCHKYLDKKFRSQIKSDFASCFSELYFCAIFKKRLGFNVSHPSDKGPDFFIRELNCWAEVTATTNGEEKNLNSIPEPPAPGIVGSQPKDQMVLRITGAFSSKAKKIKSYIEEKVIKHDQPVIICISGGWIEAYYRRHVRGDILEALLPFDVVLNLTIPDSPYYGLEPKEPIIKKGTKTPVETDYFTNPKYSHISAVIFSAVRIDDYDDKNLTKDYLKVIGDEFSIVHNPLAKNPLELGSIKCGAEECIIDLEKNTLIDINETSFEPDYP
jgi:hypothetical protein